MVNEPSDDSPSSSEDSSEESSDFEAAVKFEFEIVNCMTAFEPSEIA